ncbi:MAG: glutamine--fructose-6-phosphate aminotransferase, partial [Candidatus Zixiibacteriota bacterium]
MCGIVGYIGHRPALPILINGLKRLEYRGYDSAGIALVSDCGLVLSKSVGKIKELEKEVADNDCQSCHGIAHTRWATHGEPNYLNAHPHTNSDQTIAVVHNGIIENYRALREFLVRHNYTM